GRRSACLGAGRHYRPAAPDPRLARRKASMNDDLSGRVIAITGATGGIGRALTLACLKAGAEVVAIARNEGKLRTLHGECEVISPGKALMAVLDLEKALAADYDRLAAAVLQRYGRLDGLVHCAALLGTLTPIEHY